MKMIFCLRGNFVDAKQIIKKNFVKHMQNFGKSIKILAWLSLSAIICEFKYSLIG